MKCKHCNGTGKIKMPTFDDAMPILEEDCGKCHGTGEIEVTNEEYIRSCSTEELATVIYGIAMYDMLYNRIHNAFVLNPCEDDSAGINEVMKWLKEKHDA